jgi:hypothetical protein
MTDFSSLQPKVATSNAMNIDADLLGDDLSSAMGTETLVAHNPVPDGLPNSSGPEQQIHYIRGARYLVVDQTTNQRHSSKPFSLARALSSSPMTFFLAMAAVRRRKRRWKGEGAQRESDRDKQNKRSRQTQIRHSSPRKR